MKGDSCSKVEAVKSEGLRATPHHARDFAWQVVKVQQPEGTTTSDFA